MRASAALILLVLIGSGARAQETHDFGLPPASGFQHPVLPPPSGSQNPVLPPQSGQRYMPGIGGRFGDGGVRPVMPPPFPDVDRGVSGALSPVTRGFEGGEVARIGDIAPALRRCWTPPPLDGPDAGAMASVRFSLRRDGTLFGQPRVTWETRRGDAALQARFTRSVLDAVRSCTPMRLSAGFGASIAGRPFIIRFHGRAPSNERPI
jgi:hypothetical protein